MPLRKCSVEIKYFLVVNKFVALQASFFNFYQSLQTDHNDQRQTQRKDFQKEEGGSRGD